MINLPPNLSEDDFIFSHLSEYLGNDLNEENKNLFEELSEKGNYTKNFENFKKNKGEIQVAFQKNRLSSDDMKNLYNKVQPEEARLDLEKIRISQQEKSEKNFNNLKILGFSILTLVMCYVVWSVFSPRRPVPFDALKSLTYETLQMAKSSDLNHIAFGSKNTKEIEDYFLSSNRLSFSPVTLKNIEALGWQIIGSSVIDYDVAKISMIQYEAKNEENSLFLYSFKGKLEDLPIEDSIKLEEVKYFTFGSEKVNLITWQSSDETITFLFGWKSIKDLAILANAGSK